MKTLFTISVTSSVEREHGLTAVQAAFDEIRRIETLMTVYEPTSFLSKVNSSAGKKPIVVPSELLDIVVESQRVTKLTGGSFNIAAQTLMGLWSHKTARSSCASQECRLDLVPSRKVMLSTAQQKY
jgi:thiamine biosynthesis lipoprotein